jgi:type IV pilus assembly protein PilY1
MRMHNLPLPTRLRLLAALLTALAAASSLAAARVEAQALDVRDVRPAVMLLVDTSGSMEYALNARSGSIAGRTADCSRAERNRWISLVEVLTGRIPSYSCESINRRSAYPGAPDQYYLLPYTRPRSDGAVYTVGGTFRQEAGILDTYLERVKFGLMSYDNIYGMVTGVADEDITMLPRDGVGGYIYYDGLPFLASARGPRGDYSYADNRPVTFPGCATTYMVNAGARSEAAPVDQGALVSYGIDDEADPNRFRSINSTIQSRLLGTRPFGATPTAALLHDYEFYLNNHPDAAPPTTPGALDRLAACRPQYAILITDGQPSDPFRTTMRCDTPGFTCPYDRSVDIVSRLCRVGADGLCTSTRFRGLFSVLFQPGGAADTDVTQATSIMNEIANVGGTGSAYLASDAGSLSAAIAAALDRAATGNRTRTSPAFAATSSAYTSGSTGPQGQYELTSGFQVGTAARPWRGILNRQRYTCVGTTPVAQTLAPSDDFAAILNAQATRNIRTPITADPAQTRGIIIGPLASTYAIPAAPTGTVTRTTVAALSPFTVGNSALTTSHLALSPGQTVERDTTIRWVLAEAGSGRETAKLGDIYHGTPVVVTPPTDDIADESYNLFRRREEVAGRPATVYFGTNDGVFHAMALEDHTTPSGTVLRGGEEIWGYVPPAVMPVLNDARQAHQFLVDGQPIVRDVFFRRRPGDAPDGTLYHTVLLFGLRQGGRAYTAIDVTDPTAPVLLWQWTHEHMGQTYGRPAMTQALVDVGAGPEIRAVALLPGGHGERGLGACNVLPSNRAPRSAGQTGDARPQNSCWVGPQGRSFHVVDVATGEAIRSWTATDIQVPMTGSVSLFTGEIGSTASRAYVTSADGVIWRLDMSSSNPADWTFRPFHDIYWGDQPTAGHTSMDAPIVSVDAEGRPLIVVATGDLDNLETPGTNFVVSLTENATAVPFVATAEINWEIRLRPNELVTGPLELYDGRVYFGTFISSVTAADACQYGSSRLWGVDYRATGTLPAGYPLPGSSRSPAFGWEASAAAGTRTFSQHYQDLAANQIVMGVGVTQRPTCAVGATLPDPYIGPRYDVTNFGGGTFELVAQVSTGSTVTTGSEGIDTIRVSLPAPVSFTRTSAQALVDF